MLFVNACQLVSRISVALPFEPRDRLASNDFSMLADFRHGKITYTVKKELKVGRIRGRLETMPKRELDS